MCSVKDWKKLQLQTFDADFALEIRVPKMVRTD